MACEQIQEFKEMKGVAGVHLMLIEWEHMVPTIVKEAKLTPRPKL
jgi:methylenetetrahydrofolate reductase (NADPH)